MTKGFQSQDGHGLQIQAIIKRLRPSVIRQDRIALEDGMKKMMERYGGEALEEALLEMTKDSDWLNQIALDHMPDDAKEEFQSTAYEIMATKLEELGLKPEEHMRSCEQGFALTKSAIIAFKNDGYPNWRDFGKGVNSIEGSGLSRSPFWHQLSNIREVDGEHMMNIWAVASLFISAAHGWVPDEAKSEQGKKIIFEILPTVAPTVDIEKLMFRSRYDDRSLLKLCSLVQRAIEQKCDKAFNL